MITLKRYIALHLGLEWQAMKGLSGYYNNARFRDALLAGMFYQQDRLSEKYYSFSNYHYGNNNPNKYTDISGDSVAILPDNLHIAMLIQKDGKWGYYSINGDVYWNITYGLFGLPYDNLGEKSFDSPEAFLNSEYNKEGSYLNPRINTYGYNKAYIIPSTSLEDQIMIDSFKESSSQRYNLFNQNCATAVGDALNKAFKTNLDEIFPSKLYEIIVNRLIGKEIIYKDGTR